MSDPAGEALMRVIEERRKDDPLIGAKVGGREVAHRLMNAMKTGRGVHIESLLTALGALAGYSCQASLRAQAIAEGRPGNAAFAIVTARDGKQFFFGDPLNQALAESHYSVWSLAAGAARNAGCKDLPDIAAIFKHVSATVGSDSFGIPRLPEGHRAGDTPINYLKALWPGVQKTAEQFCQKATELPILFGLALQEVIGMSKSVIEPALALKIVMESAIPMSKVDLPTS